MEALIDDQRFEPDVAPTLATRRRHDLDCEAYIDDVRSPDVAEPVTTRPYADRGSDANLVVAVEAAPTIGASGAGFARTGNERTETDALVVQEQRGAFGEIAHTLSAEGHDASEDGTGRGQPLVVGFSPTQDTTQHDDNVPTLHAHDALAVAFDAAQITSRTIRSAVAPGEPAPTLSAESQTRAIVGAGRQMIVRRVMPLECEKLQGVPPGWTLIPDPRRQNKPAADQPRYHALGNAFPVPVVLWIGQRIDSIDEALTALGGDGLGDVFDAPITNNEPPPEQIGMFA